MKKKKILITGAGGFLGSRCASFFEHRGWVVCACSHEVLDITKEEEMKNRIRAEAPEVVLHCAAISDTGYAAQHPELSEQINVTGTVNAALACAACGAKLVYISSDQVYSGCQETGPLPETVLVAPSDSRTEGLRPAGREVSTFITGVYGRQKFQAEQAVSRICPDAVGLRLTWMYDHPDSQFRLNKNLLLRLQDANRTGIPIKAARNEYRGITFVWDVISRLEQCFALPGGVYNFGCENKQNSYETLRKAAEICGYDPDRIIEVDEMFCRNLAMDTGKIKSCGISFPETIEGLRSAMGQG